MDDGCRTEGCNLTPLQAAIDAQKLKKLQQESDDRKCKAGNQNYCSGYVNLRKQIKEGATQFIHDAYNTLTTPSSTLSAGDIVEPAVNLACSHPYVARGPCPAQARGAGEAADTVLDVLSGIFNMVNNSNGPSINANPQTPTPTSPSPTWTPDPTPTGVTPTNTMTPGPTTPTVSPTISLTPTQFPTWTPTMTPTLPYITPTY